MAAHRPLVRAGGRSVQLPVGDTVDPNTLGQNLSALASLTGAANRLPYFTGVGALSLTTLTVFGRLLIEAADAAAGRGVLGLGGAATYGVTSGASGQANGLVWRTNDFDPATKQPLDATLTALAALTTAANQMVYSTGANAFAMTSLTAFARTLMDDADAAAARVTIGAEEAFAVGGWTNLTLINGWTNSISTTRVRRIGPFAELQVSLSGGTGEAFTVPSGFRPVADFYGVFFGGDISGNFTRCSYSYSNFRVTPGGAQFYGSWFYYVG